MRGGGGEGGGTPLYKPYRYVPPHRVGFLCGFGLKTGIRVYAFSILVWNRVWFLRELRDCKISLSFQFQRVRKKEKYANSKWI